MKDLKVSVPRDVRPVLQYREGFSPRNIAVPDGEKLFQYLHNKYWAILDGLEEGNPGYRDDIIKWAWDHAATFANGHPYDYVYELFGWTLPFEICLNRALAGALKYDAANDFLDGVYECFEHFLNDYEWPTPLTYRRIITDPRIS